MTASTCDPEVMSIQYCICHGNRLEQSNQCSVVTSAKRSHSHNDNMCSKTVTASCSRVSFVIWSIIEAIGACSNVPWFITTYVVTVLHKLVSSGLRAVYRKKASAVCP